MHACRIYRNTYTHTNECKPIKRQNTNMHRRKHEHAKNTRENVVEHHCKRVQNLNIRCFFTRQAVYLLALPVAGLSCWIMQPKTPIGRRSRNEVFAQTKHPGTRHEELLCHRACGGSRPPFAVCLRARLYVRMYVCVYVCAHACLHVCM